MRPAAPLAALLVGCAVAPRCPPAELSPLAEPPAFAVVASDYGSTAIGLLDAEGALSTEAWMDSGTYPPGLTAALSGDVVLSTAPIDACSISVIDRFGTDVVNVLDFCDPARALRAQWSARGAPGGAAWRANPQDVVRVGGEAWVTRFEPNLDPAAPELARGDDVLRLDAETGAALGRVDLSSLGAELEDGGRAHARPARAALLRAGGEERVVVALARLSTDFMRAADGAVAVIDPADRSVTSRAFPGLSNCGQLTRAGPDAALVGCAGDPFGDAEQRRARGGLILLALGEDGRVSFAPWRAAEHPDVPLPDTAPTHLGGSRVAAVSAGSTTGDEPDRAWLLDLDAGSAERLLVADAAFVIGQSAWDPSRALLLVPDAARGEIRRFHVPPEGAPAELAPVPASPCRHLPPREVRRVGP